MIPNVISLSQAIRGKRRSSATPLLWKKTESKQRKASPYRSPAKSRAGISSRPSLISTHDVDHKNVTKLVRFLNYLLAALQAAAPAIKEDLQAPLQSPHPPPAEEILTALINQMVAASPPHPTPEKEAVSRPQFVLVMDDYHLITAPQIHEAISFLLDHQPACLHLILITRADPPLPIPRLRGQGQLLEIRQDDLRFTGRETAVFLQEIMGVMLGEQEVSTLATRAEGWIAGLQMAALALRNRPNEETATFVAGFTGTHRYILDYLLEEVLQRQPPQIQQFLLQTSILDRLSAPLCDAALNPEEPEHFPLSRSRTQEILDYLDAHNLFLVTSRRTAPLVSLPSPLCRLVAVALAANTAGSAPRSPPPRCRLV